MENVSNFFKFLKDKEGKEPPLKYKLLYEPDSITPEDLIVTGDLNLYGTNITSLPDNLTVGGYLDLSRTPISSLPNNLEVEKGVYLTSTKIASFPNNLRIGGSVYIGNTPLRGKYSEEEIKKMIEDKGGNFEGSVF